MYSSPAAGLRTAPGRFWGRVTAALLAATLASATGSTRADEATPPPLTPPPELAETLAGGVPESVEGLRLLQKQVREVVALATPVTVAVELDDSVGSGVIVSEDGLVLTAGHVCVEPNRELSIRFPDGHRVKGLSLGINHTLDCGLARITDAPPRAAGAERPAWPFLPIADDEVRQGEWVVCLGQPNGFVDGREPPVRLGRVLSVKDELINTDATLVGGDSGGPLFNLRGEVVAIHSKIGEQITSNYHVPVTAFRNDWTRLIEGRMTGVPDGEDPDDWRPMVGLALRAHSDDEGDGLVVTQVFPRLAAAQAGVAVGDVLLQFGGEELSTLEQIDRLVRRQEPFSHVPLVVRRGDMTIELDLWLGRASADFPGTLADQGDR